MTKKYINVINISDNYVSVEVTCNWTNKTVHCKEWNTFIQYAEDMAEIFLFPFNHFISGDSILVNFLNSTL